MKNAIIVVVGSSNTDMVVRVPRIPAPGETIMGGDFFVIPGGKGANQAVAAARAGASVTFLACVGDDDFGKQAIENYRNDEIDTSFIKVEKGVSSGVAMINVSADGENSITVASGANSYLRPDDISKRIVAFRDIDIVLVQLETPQETVVAVAQTANSLNIPLILNPAPAAALADELLKMVSVITPNETEAALLTGRKEFNEQDIPAMAAELFEKGVETVIITLGKKGVFLKNANYEEHIPGFLVKAVDTTAAGDVFNGALAAALAEKKSILDAINFAQRAAAISVTRMGAQPSAPRLGEIEGFDI